MPTMKPIVISKFGGIAPRFGKSVKVGMAEICENCDLSDGGLAALKDHPVEDATVTTGNSLIKYNGTWLSGTDTHYLPWKLGGIDLLFSVVGGVIKKTVGTITVDAGHEPPTAAPGLTNLATPVACTFGGTTPAAGVVCTFDYTTDTVIKTLHGLTDAEDSLLFTNVGGALPTGIFAETVYYVLNAASGTFQLMFYNGGVLELVDFTDNGSGTSSYHATPTGESPLETLVNKTSHGLSNGDRVSFSNSGGALPTGLSVGTVYYVVNKTTHTFEVSLVSGGSPVEFQYDGTGTPYYTKLVGLTGFQRYLVVTKRTVGGHTDRSGPGPVSAEIDAGLGSTIRVTKPTITEAYVTEWEIYRLSNATAEYLFVVSLPVGTTTYDDVLADADLGAALDTEYTSDQGNTITWAKPLTGIDGLSTDIYAGMVFAWNGSALYWCEPGYPDAWPEFYTVNFPSSIMAVVPFAGSVVVLCASGPMRLDGTHPELLQQSKVIGKEPAISGTAYETTRGVAYLSDSGIVMFDLANTTVITDPWFTEEWFEDNVDFDTAKLIENDGKFYLFHSTGTLFFDARTKVSDWQTMEIAATAVYRDSAAGSLFVLTTTGVREIHGGSGDLEYTWRSGELRGAVETDKVFESVVLTGTGSPILSVYVDDDLVATKTMNLDSELERDVELKLPEGTYGKYAQVQLSSAGTVDTARLEYSI